MEIAATSRRGWTSRLPIIGTPLVSFIVSAYNRPAEIKVCVGSLLVQTYGHIEILVVHSGLGTEVRESIKQIGDKRVRFVEIERAHDFGNSCREHGALLAQGQWIGQTNDDNYYVPVYVEWMLSELLRNEAEFAYCNMIHSHYAWAPFETHPTPCRIDAGGWICRADIVKRTPWPTKDRVTSDGEYAEALARQSRVVKVPGFLFVHN